MEGGGVILFTTIHREWNATCFTVGQQLTLPKIKNKRIFFFNHKEGLALENSLLIARSAWYYMYGCVWSLSVARLFSLQLLLCVKLSTLNGALIAFRVRSFFRLDGGKSNSNL